MEDRHVSVKKISLIATGVVSALVLAVFGGSLFETNDAGFYQVKQAFITGEMSSRVPAGTYWQGFGTITTYPFSTTVKFGSENEKEAGDDKTMVYTSKMDVTFQGNSKADVSGSIKYELSKSFDNQQAIHEVYRSNDAVAETLVRQTLAEAIKNTGPMFTPEDARTTRREEFTTRVLEQTLNGLYATKSKTVTVTDEDGRRQQEVITELKLDKDGNPIIVKESPLKRFGVAVTQLVIRGLDFDEVTESLMMAKKKAEQEKVVARANAEKAKQDAITAQEQGKAKVATAEAEKLVEKIRAVTDAQKEFEVAQFAKKKAAEEAKARILKGEADARVQAQLVRAGLSPREKADIAKETAIGVAKELAQIKLPASMVIVGGSGGSKGGNLDPFTAIGINQLMEVTDKMAKKGVAAVK